MNLYNMFITRSKLKNQFISLFLTIFLISGFLTLLIVYSTLNQKTQDIGRDFATEYALKEKSRISAPIKREVTLSKKMADSPLLKEWANNESDQALKTMAIKELESYKKHFKDQRYFFIIDRSKNYYFNNKDNKYKDDKLVYTLNDKNPDDRWYFTTIKKIDGFAINVDDNTVLQETNIWINVIMKDENENKIGIVGTGLNLTNYLEQFIETNNGNITPLIFDSLGAIKAYNKTALIDKNTLAKDSSQRSTIYKLITNQEDIKKLRNAMSQLKNEDEVVKTINIEFNKHQSVAAITYLPEIDWYVTTFFQLSNIYSVWDYRNIIGTIIISMLLLIILTIFFTNKMILNPLGELHASIQEVSAGNYNYKVNINENNEFGQLASSFNKMASEINMYTDNLEQLVDERTEELITANEILEEKNQKITDSILYAKNIQNSILPEKDKLNSIFKDYFVIWQPKDIVGGDFYWYKNSGNQYLIAVADCTGHGVPGSLMAMTANTLLERITANNTDLDPAEMLHKLNILLKDVLYRNNDNQEIDDGLDIALCKVIPEERKIIFSGARLSLLYTNDKQLARIKGDRQSIGYRRSLESFKYNNHSIDIKENMNFYISTDGYFDQNGGTKNKRLGLKTFTNIIEENYELGLSRQGEILRNRLMDHMASVEQRDDITVLGFRVKL